MIFSPEIVNLSSGLVHERASCAEREFGAIDTLWVLLLPCASASLNVFGADWQVSVVSMSFITDCSALLSGSGKYLPPVSVAILFRRAWSSGCDRPVLNPIT